MVIRRIREHVSTHNWFAVSVDLAIVVVGVFLGTQVSNWNAARIERETGRNYRTRLIVELRSDEAQIRQKIAYYEAVKEHGLRLLASLHDPSPKLGTGFLVDAYQLTQIDPTRGKRFIFDEMVNGGYLGSLGTEEEQRLSADFYQQLETYNSTLVEIFPYRDTLRQEMPYDVQSEIRSRCGDQNVASNGKFVGIGLPTECPIKLPPQVLARAVSKVRAVPNLESLATRYISSVDQKIGTFRFTLNQATALREALSRPS
jgi:hypothetical protein